METSSRNFFLHTKHFTSPTLYRLTGIEMRSDLRTNSSSWPACWISSRARRTFRSYWPNDDEHVGECCSASFMVSFDKTASDGSFEFDSDPISSFVKLLSNGFFVVLRSKFDPIFQSDVWMMNVVQLLLHLKEILQLVFLRRFDLKLIQCSTLLLYELKIKNKKYYWNSIFWSTNIHLFWIEIIWQYFCHINRHITVLSATYTHKEKKT